jgi:hypothetical protein
MVTSPTSLPDAELAAAVAAGDRTADAFLYERYSDRIFYLALSERCSREDAEDVRAETFLRVIHSLRDGKLRKPDSISSFIVGIALNVIREHKRQRVSESLTDTENEIRIMARGNHDGRTGGGRLILAAAARLKSVIGSFCGCITTKSCQRRDRPVAWHQGGAPAADQVARAEAISGSLRPAEGN